MMFVNSGRFIAKQLHDGEPLRVLEEAVRAQQVPLLQLRNGVKGWSSDPSVLLSVLETPAFDASELVQLASGGQSSFERDCLDERLQSSSGRETTGGPWRSAEWEGDPSRRHRRSGRDRGCRACQRVEPTTS